jgi:hypothetical protein
VPAIITKTPIFDTRHLVLTAEAAKRRFDRLKLDRVALLLLQDAPRPEDRDPEALACGTATRRNAIRIWQLSEEADLGRLLAINVHPAPPRMLRNAVAIAATRIEAVLRAAGDRVGTVAAVGAPQREPLARVLDLPHVPDWNETIRLGAMEVAMIYHPSPRCRAYNPGGPGAAAVPLLRRWLKAA